MKELLIRWLAGKPKPPAPTRSFTGAFGLLDGSVISVEGRNYVPQKETPRVWLHNRLIRSFDNERKT